MIETQAQVLWKASRLLQATAARPVVARGVTRYMVEIVDEHLPAIAAGEMKDQDLPRSMMVGAASQWLLLAAAISVWALSGCKSEPGRTRASEASASARPLSSAAPRTEPPPGPKLVDLVHETAALLVSSSHRDANSRVEFLGDEQPSSAWRPNPPDPAPWFELRLAHEVEVRSLSVSALGTEATPPVELELELHSPELGAARRERERYVFQPAEAVRTSSLRISVKRAGAIPGRPPAAGIALSELQAEGFVAAARVLPRAHPEGRAHRSGPVASIGTPAFRNFWRGAPYASPDALCAAYERAMELPQTEVPEGRKFAYCEVPPKPLKVEAEAPANVRAVFNGWVADNADEMGGNIITLLMVQTDAGWSAANLWSDNTAYTGMCPGMHVASSVIQRTAWVGTVLEQERARLYYPPSPLYTSSGQPGPFDKPVAGLSLMRCDVVDRLTCREHLLRYGRPEVAPTSVPSAPWPVPPKEWIWQRSFAVSANGWLRFSPCRRGADADAGAVSGAAAGAAVPCLAPGLGVLP